MKRVLRQDKMLLESLENKYGTDAIANAIIAIANKQNGIDEIGVNSQEEAMIDFIKYIEGVRIRLRELHWAAERNSKHVLTDSIIKSLEDFEDNIAEDLMGVFDFRIEVGAIVPTMTNQVELIPLLNELYDHLVSICASVENDKRFGGIVNEIEDLMHDVNKWKYLATFK